MNNYFLTKEEKGQALQLFKELDGDLNEAT